MCIKQSYSSLGYRARGRSRARGRRMRLGAVSRVADIALAWIPERHLEVRLGSSCSHTPHVRGSKLPDIKGRGGETNSLHACMPIRQCSLCENDKRS